MLRYYARLLKRFLIISWKKKRAFNFEFLMMFVHLAFNFSFILIFWGALLSHIDQLGQWTFPELALYTGITFLGDSIGGIFFAFRDLPQNIVSGNLDKFLVRPVNTLFAVLFEKVSIVYFLEQFIASIMLITIIVVRYAIAISASSILISLIILIVGVFIYNMVYGLITFLSFWFGKLGVFRNIIFGLASSKKYPITVFPTGIQWILTYLIPVALVSYYPAAIFLNKINVNIKFLSQILLLLLVVSTIFKYAWNQGLKRYEANGG